MHKVITIALAGILVVSIVQLLQFSDAIIDLFILGIIPGTQHELTFAQTLAIITPSLFGLHVWQQGLNDSILNYRVAQANTDRKLTKQASESEEFNTAIDTEQPADASTQQAVDIEDLDALSL